MNIPDNDDFAVIRADVNRILSSRAGRDLARYVTERMRAREPWTCADTRRVLELSGEPATVARSVASVIHLRAVSALVQSGAVVVDEHGGRYESTEPPGARAIDAVGLSILGRLGPGRGRSARRM